MKRLIDWILLSAVHSGSPPCRRGVLPNRRLGGLQWVDRELFRCVVVVALLVSGTSAQGTEPEGHNFQIAARFGGNDTATGRPSVAYDGVNFLVVWKSGPGGVRAGRVTPAGLPLDDDGIPISTEAEWPPSVAFDGTNYLVVWVHNEEVYGARIAPDGTALDATPVQITTEGQAKPRPVSLAFDGANYLIAWRTGGDRIRAARVSTAASIVDGQNGFELGGGFYPWVAFDGTNYLVVWHAWGNGLDILGNRVSTDGQVLDGTGFVISGADGNQDHASVAFGGETYFVAWHDWTDAQGALQCGGGDWCGSARGSRVTTSGVVLDDPEIVVGPSMRGQGPPSVTWDGEHFFVVWMREQQLAKRRLTDVYGRRVAEDGTVVDPQAVPIATNPGHNWSPRSGFGDGQHLVVWDEGSRCLPLDCETYGGDCAAVFNPWCPWGQMVRTTDPASRALSPSEARTPIDGGAASWRQEPAPTDKTLYAVLALSDTEAYAVGEHEDPWQGTDHALHGTEGLGWYVVTTGLPPTCYGLWGEESDIWTVCGCGRPARYDGDSLEVSPRCWDDDGLGIWPLDANLMLTAGNRGQGDLFIRNSTLRGIDRYASIAPYALEDSFCPQPWDGDPSRFRQPCWRRPPRALWDAWGSGPEKTFAVGAFGTIARLALVDCPSCTLPGAEPGAEWLPVAGVPTFQSLNGVWGRSETDVFVVGDFGTILRFDGAGWSLEDSGTTEHLFDIASMRDGTLFAVGSNGTILRSSGDGVWIPEESGTNAWLMGVSGAQTRVWAVGAGLEGPVILRRSIDLSATGSCPGEVSFEVENASADGAVAFALGLDEGATTIPGGLCPGIQIDLTEPRLVAEETADPTGALSKAVAIPAAACGNPVQAVDLSTCEKTNVVRLPD